MSSEDLAFWLEVIGKIVLYGALLPAVGACAARLLLLPGLSAGDRERAEIDAALARAGTMAIAFVFCALMLRLLTHTIAVFGIPDAFAVSQIRTVAIESRWGSGWRIQAVAAAVWLAIAIAGRSTRRGSLLSAIAAVAVCYSIPLVGHAARDPWRIAIHGTHVVGASLWLGTLGVVALVDFGTAGRNDSAGRETARARRIALLRRFTPIALSGCAALVASGATAAWIYLAPLSSLWTTSYGRLLAVKLAFVAVAASCGFFNWRRFRSERATGIHRDDRAPLVALEVMVAVAVVLITALLTETAHP